MTKGGQKTFFAHQKKMGESLSKNKKKSNKKNYHVKGSTAKAAMHG